MNALEHMASRMEELVTERSDAEADEAARDIEDAQNREPDRVCIVGREQALVMIGGAFNEFSGTRGIRVAFTPWHDRRRKGWGYRLSLEGVRIASAQPLISRRGGRRISGGVIRILIQNPTQESVETGSVHYETRLCADSDFVRVFGRAIGQFFDRTDNGAIPVPIRTSRE